MILSENQEKIIQTQGNLIVSANAGTGKTTTMVSKIVFDIQNNHDHKVIAAITFTIKASKDIKNKLTIDTSKHFIGTINSFAVEEVIKPFMKDVYGMEWNLDMSTDYSVEVTSFIEGIEKIKKEKIIPSYNDNRKNFVFQLALDIIRRSKACSLYFQARYFKIYIDEYQDCDKDMHDFFMYINKNLKIEFFIIGDEKQSIYIWRGAHPESFLEILKNPDFKRENLIDNHRSCLQIQNYSNLLFENTREFYKENLDLNSIFFINTSSRDCYEESIKYLDLTKKIALLRYRKEDARKGAELLSNIGVKFQYIPQIPIASITTNSSWLYNAIASFFIKDKYSIFDFLNEMPENFDNNKVKKYISLGLNKIEEHLCNNDLDDFINEIENFIEYFGYTTKTSEIEKLYDTIKIEENHSAFNIESYNNIAATFHSTKGLEFNQVIVFADDYPLNSRDSIYNHYVAVTRAELKLIVICTNSHYSNYFLDNLSDMLSEAKQKLENVVTII